MNSSTRMMPTPLTYEDYCQIPADGKRHEIIHGAHHVSPAPGYKHQRIVANLHILIELFLREKEAGKIILAPFDVVLTDHEVVQPDLLFIASSHESIITEKNIQGVPDLLIEILSEGNRRNDEIMKRNLYEQFEVPEYWIVDPELETVKVYRLTGITYDKPVLLSRKNEDLLKTPILPGLHLNLVDVFGR